MRATKPTLKQRKLLAKNGIQDSTDYVYLGMKIVTEGGESLAKNDLNGMKVMEFKNKTTGECITIEEDVNEN